MAYEQETRQGRNPIDDADAGKADVEKAKKAFVIAAREAKAWLPYRGSLVHRSKRARHPSDNSIKRLFLPPWISDL